MYRTANISKVETHQMTDLSSEALRQPSNNGIVSERVNFKNILTNCFQDQEALT